MEKEIAEYVSHVLVRSASETSRLMPILKRHLDEDEYVQYRDALVKISKTIATDLLFKIYAEHPEIDEKFDRIIEEYGRLP